MNKEQLCFKEKALFAGSGVQSGHAMPTPRPSQLASLLPDLQGLLLPNLLCQLPNQSPVLAELEF